MANQAGLWLFVPSSFRRRIKKGLADNGIVSLPNLLGKSMRRLVLPGDMKQWILTSLQGRLNGRVGRWYAMPEGWYFSSDSVENPR